MKLHPAVVTTKLRNVRPFTVRVSCAAPCVIRAIFSYSEFGNMSFSLSVEIRVEAPFCRGELCSSFSFEQLLIFSPFDSMILLSNCDPSWQQLIMYQGRRKSYWSMKSLIKVRRFNLWTCAYVGCFECLSLCLGPRVQVCSSFLLRQHCLQHILALLHVDGAQSASFAHSGKWICRK
jgi:hypothetical protein